MFENIVSFFKKFGKKEQKEISSKDAAKERLHLVLMQDRANVSADFLDMMRKEIIEVIKKYIDVDESDIDVRLTNKTNEDGTTGAPALYANIPITGIKEEAKKESSEEKTEETSKKIEESETEIESEDKEESIDEEEIEDETEEEKDLEDNEDKVEDEKIEKEDEKSEESEEITDSEEDKDENSEK